MRSIAAMSAFASTGSRRAGRAKLSEYGSGSTSISPSSSISAYRTYEPPPKFTTLRTLMSSRSSASEICICSQTAVACRR